MNFAFKQEESKLSDKTGMIEPEKKIEKEALKRLLEKEAALPGDSDSCSEDSN